MNRILIYICAFLIVSCTNTKPTVDNQKTETTTKLDRSQPPKAGPAPEIKIGEHESFQLDNGLKVYVVQNDKIPRVAFSLRIDKDPIVEGDKAGYSSIAGSLLSRGTTTRSKAEIDEATDFIGASLATSSSGMYGASLTKHQDQLLTIMQDVLMNPSFPQEELDKLKKLQISNLISAKDDPTEIISNIRSLVVYGKDHPYGEIVTEKTIENISREDVVNFYHNYWSPRGAYLAIVGDITVADAKVLANKYFGDWQGANLPKHSYEQPKAPEKSTVILVDRPQSVQSEIRVSYPIDLKLGDKEFFAVSLMNQILGGGASGRLYKNLREDKGYTYGIYSGFNTDKVVARFSAGGSVRNEVTDSAIYEVLKELEDIAENGVTEDELRDVKAYITGSFARSLESPQTIASFAINTAVNNLDENFYPDYLKSLNAVTVEEVNAAAKKYIKYNNAYIIVVGKASEIEDKLKQFGTVQYYDADGNSYDPAEMKALPKGMDVNAVLDNYLNALGGKKKLSAVLNVKKEWSLEMQGQVLNIVEVQTIDGKFREDVMMGGQVIQQTICDGKNMMMIANGQPQQLDDATKISEMISNRLFPELSYTKSGIKMKLDGKQKVNGEDAYQVVLVYFTGDQTEAYYDVKTGYKVKETFMISTPAGEMTKAVIYDNYKMVDGINFAHSKTTGVGNQVFTVNLESVEINAKMPGDYFKVAR
ncbi:MAG: insulinase family protein [Bacteroidetes bacterium]|nr:insulinase family protein [Bacteroidota bacterium]